MLTTLSLWGIYFASYCVDYVLILTILVAKHFIRGEKEDSLAWGILVAFVVLSLVIIDRVRKIGMNTRIKSIPEKNITHEMIGYLLAQVITVATTLFTDWWVFINALLFVVVGVFFVKSKAIHTSPLFVVPLGNRIYQAGEDTIITKYSLQEMRLKQEDNPDGLEARELTNRVYFVRKQ